MVPDGWHLGRVQDLLDGLDSGVSVNATDRSLKQNEWAVLKISSVTYGKFNPLAVKVIESNSELERAKTNPRAGQILISRSNTEELVGASAYIENDYTNLFLPDKLWQTRSKPNAHMRWLSYVLASRYSRYTLSNLATGTSGSMKNITKGELLGLKLSIPPLPEQKKIAKILQTWDRAIATTEKLIDASKQQKKALMQQLLTGKKRFPGFEGEWEKAVVKDVVSITYGKSPKDIFSPEGQFNVIGTGGVTGRTNSTICTECAVVIGRKGTIDKPQYITEPFWAIDTTFYCLPKNSDIDIHWFYFLSVILKLKQYNEASGVPSLSRETIYSIPVYVPCLNEQRKIATTLHACDKRADALHLKLTHLKQEKKALMQQLLTGKRRVKVDA